MYATSSGRGGPSAFQIARIVSDRSWPRMYSIEMKYSPSTAPSSKMWTMFGWLRRADSFASSTNILMKDASSERCGRIRLTTNTRSKPAGPWIRPLNTSAMPPRPMRSNSVYLPNWIGSGSWVAAGKTLEGKCRGCRRLRRWAHYMIRPGETAANNGPSVLVLVAGGIDPSGGAGLLRDVATAAARGARAYAVGTAWTEQGDGVHRVEPRAPAAIRDALARAVATLRPAAVKIGMAVGPGDGRRADRGAGELRRPGGRRPGAGDVTRRVAVGRRAGRDGAAAQARHAGDAERPRGRRAGERPRGDRRRAEKRRRASWSRATASAPCWSRAATSTRPSRS